MPWRNKNKSKPWTASKRPCPLTGKKIAPSFETIDEAKAWEQLADDAIKSGIALPPANEVADHLSLHGVLKRVFSDFYSIKSKQYQIGANTAKNYLLRYFDPHAPFALVWTEQNVNRYLREQWIQSDFSQSYINQHIVFASTVSKLAHRWGLVPTRVPVPEATKPEETRFEWLTHDEADQLIAAMPRPYRPLLAFINATGLRAHEALKARPRTSRVMYCTSWVRVARYARCLCHLLLFELSSRQTVIPMSRCLLAGHTTASPNA